MGRCEVHSGEIRRDSNMGLAATMAPAGYLQVAGVLVILAFAPWRGAQILCFVEA